MLSAKEKLEKAMRLLREAMESRDYYNEVGNVEAARELTEMAKEGHKTYVLKKNRAYNEYMKRSRRLGQ